MIDNPYDKGIEIIKDMFTQIKTECPDPADLSIMEAIEKECMDKLDEGMHPALVMMSLLIAIDNEMARRGIPWNPEDKPVVLN